MCICLSVDFESRGSMDAVRKLFGSLKALVLGSGISFSLIFFFFFFFFWIFFRVVGKTLLRIDKLYL